MYLIVLSLLLMMLPNRGFFPHPAIALVSLPIKSARDMERATTGIGETKHEQISAYPAAKLSPF